jgi:DNA excision repair protein ERCC-6
MIFTDDLLEEITHQTNLYAHREKNIPDWKVSKAEIEQFLGICLLSGYHNLPEEHHYWSTQPDLGVKMVSSTMSKNRFLSIKRHLHFADNQALPEGNKFAKISPVYDALNKTLVKFGIFHRLLSIDESMVPYYGRHSGKMYIKGKPIRFGYKLWSLCASNGYPYHLIMYQGKDLEAPKQPLGSRVINRMVDVIVTESAAVHHEVYFDNFFTSYDLMTDLSRRDICATGTIRENRTAGAGKAMVDSKQLKKKERGTFDYRSDGEVFVAKWNDNSVVGIASNWQTHQPVGKVLRRVRGRGQQEVTQPRLISSYNKGMGGVDLYDRLCGTYRPQIRGKKWYWPLATHALNTSVVAAWRVHCAMGEDRLSHLDFRRNITLCLLKSAQDKPQRARVAVGFPSDVRYDGVGHDRVTIKEGRCAVCQKNTTKMCFKCGVRLHCNKGKPCFDMYHEH